MVRRFDPDSLRKSGSRPSPKQMYHFASENNAQFLMKCVSDTGNCRTLVSADIVSKWNIPLHSASVNDTLNTVTGKKIKVTGQIMLEATFNNKTCYFDALVTNGLEKEILVQGRRKVGAWGALAPPMFGQTVNPISTRGADYTQSLALPHLCKNCP